ncbi:MAG TPA: hypothetical protein PLY35_12420 [Thermotogota bacterium]|nr:hypothetical protein [Thermotogota bacterium]
MKTENEINELLDELRKGIPPEDVIEHFNDNKKSELYDKIIKIALLQ